MQCKLTGVCNPLILINIILEDLVKLIKEYCDV